MVIGRVYQEAVGHPLEVMTPLEDHEVLILIPLAHPTERAEEVPRPRPQTLHRVHVALPRALPDGTAPSVRLGPRGVSSPTAPAGPAPHPAVPAPLVGVDHRPLQARTLDDLAQFGAAGRLQHLQADLTR